jgi:hypothetical protein
VLIGQSFTSGAWGATYLVENKHTDAFLDLPALVRDPSGVEHVLYSEDAWILGSSGGGDPIQVFKLCYQYVTDGPPRLVSPQVVVMDWPGYRPLSPAAAWGPDGYLHVVCTVYVDESPTPSEDSELWYLRVQPGTGKVMQLVQIGKVFGGNPPDMEHMIWPSVVCRGTAQSPEVHVVWSQHREGLQVDDHDVFYQRSLDGGDTWLSDPVRVSVTNDPSYQEFQPKLYASATSSDLWVAYQRETLQNDFLDDDVLNTNPKDIYCQHSSDGGLTWGTPERVTNSSSSSYGMVSPQIQRDPLGVLYVMAVKKFYDGPKNHYIEMYKREATGWAPAVYNPLATNAAHDAPTRLPYYGCYPSFVLTDSDTFTICYEAPADDEPYTDPEEIWYVEYDSGVQTRSQRVWRSVGLFVLRTVVHAERTNITPNQVHAYWSMNDEQGPDILFTQQDLQ